MSLIHFVTASHHEQILKYHLMQSPAMHSESFTVLRGVTNIPEAFNSMHIQDAEYVCYIHHDVYLPPSFIDDFLEALQQLPENFGVLGVAGVKSGRLPRGYILDRGREWGDPRNLPAEVETLDEMLLIMRAGEFHFDQSFPFDFYGADICMQAKMAHKPNYAIKAYCEHRSSRPIGGRTPAFFQAQEEFKIKWKNYLPISTTCSIVS